MSHHRLLVLTLLSLTACPGKPQPDGGATGGGATGGGATGGGATGGGATGGGATGGGATGGGATGGGATGGGASGGPPDAGPNDCGNRIREGIELCDDGNNVDTDDCRNNCTYGAAAPYCGDGMPTGAEACDDGNSTSQDGCEADCTVSVAAPSNTVCGDGARQGPEQCDDGNLVAGDGCEPDCSLSTPSTVTCPAFSSVINRPTRCDTIPGDRGRLVVGTVLLPGKVLRGGQVLINSTGDITCVGCDCSASAGFASATKLLCGANVVSPGLVNAHDHITFTAAPYAGIGTPSDSGIPERYEHRHDWRVGGASHAGHFSIPSGGQGSSQAIQWSELRQVMAGTTSVAGSGGVAGLLRNLDKADTSATGPSQQGLGANTGGASYETFPLRDTSGTELTEGCGYASVPNASAVPAMAAYLPHIAEGIERSARNEFLCLSGVLDGGSGVFTPRTAMIHGIALKPADVRWVAAQRASLIWSPRSNVSLYGETAPVAVYARNRANIALGTDWVRSGSMNVLRELQCADYLSSSFYGRTFSAESLWRMATVNAARATAVSSRTGVLASGRAGDVAVFRAAAGDPYRAVISARAEDVILTLRGGTVLFGDDEVVQVLDSNCTGVTVCNEARRVCLGEIGTTYVALAAANANSYPLFFCAAPPANEPTCTPVRGAPWLFSGANAYSGTPVAGADSDGDGIADVSDNCPRYFNPVTPQDFGIQADADRDGVGDVCDVCPLQASTTNCAAHDANDADGDGVTNLSDKCPMDPDPTQADADGDGKGDVCDFCPTLPNPGAATCPPPPGMLATILQIKTGVATGRVQLVNVLATGVGAGGLFVQDTAQAFPENSGLFLYYPGPSGRSDVRVGDRVTLPSGLVQDFNGQTQVASIPAGSIVVLSSNNPMPSPVVVTPDEVRTGGPRAAALEGVFVRLNNVTVANVMPTPDVSDTPPTNEFTVNQPPATAELLVNDYLSVTTPFPTVSEQLGFIQGILERRNGNSKLEPRGDTDMQRPVQLISFGPPGQFTREAMPSPASTIPSPLRIRINSVQPTDTVVNLASDAGVVVPSTVTILAGQVQAEVPVQGVTQSLAEPILAWLGATAPLSTSVRVLGATEQPAVSSCSPQPLLLPEDGTADLTVTLDIPPAAATAVALSADAGFALVPPSITVSADARAATVQVIAAPGATGNGEVVATLGSSMISCPVTLTNLPATSHVVISEVQVAGANANDEFVELYNPTGQEVDISGWRLQYKSATGTAYQAAGQFPPGAKISARGYYLYASGPVGTAYTGATTPDAVRLTNAGAPTALAFGGTAGHVRIGPSGLGTAVGDPSAIDTLGYGVGASAPEGGAAAPAPSAGSSLERKATANSTAASMASGGADALLGNALDTDNNAADFVLRSGSQPQNRSSTAEP